MAQVLEVKAGETIEVASPNVVEIWRDGDATPMGFIHRGLSEVLYLTGKEGYRFILTDDLPNPLEW